MEDMLNAVQVANQKLRINLPNQGDLTIFSMDPTALYFPLNLQDIKDGIHDMVINTDIQFGHIDSQQLTKFIGIMYNEDEQSQ